MSPATRISIASLSLPASLLLGSIAVLAADSNTWLYRHGWVVWLGFYAAAMAVAYVTVALLHKRSILLHACSGGLVTALLAGGFLFGAFLVYALGIGGRTAAEFSEYSEMTWQDQLVFMTLATGFVGAFLGAMTGMFRRYIDHAGGKMSTAPSGSGSTPHFS
jgi:hypothetical protein